MADGHLVVVEDDQHIGALVACMSQGFKGHAAGDRAITYHCDGFAIAALLAGGQGHAHGG